MTTTPATSPLLELSGLPRFDTILPAHVEPAVRSLLDALHSTIERLQDDPTPPTWTNFVEPIENESERVGRAWGVAAHMHSVMDTPEWREAYNTMLPEVTRFYAELGQNLKLFEKYKAIRNGAEFATLSPARQRIIDNELRGFRLSGAELSDEQKPRFQAIQEELASLGAKFSENVLDATNAFAHVVTDQAELAGLPDDVIAAARESAEKAGVEGWKFGLKMPSYLPVMQYADSRSLRETFYRAYSTRAAEIDNGFSKPEWDNGPLIGKLLALRTEEAKMLGYNNYAEVSLVPKMADSTDQVLGFLRELAVKAKPFAEKDLAELQAFAKDELGLDTLQPWDVTYVSEKLRGARYAFSEQEVKEYLPEHKVLQGLFGVVEKLYQINIKPDSGPVWHPDVRFFRIERDGELIGQFYLDLYARDTKKGGAWMDSAITRRRIPDGIETPVAYLVCNFPGPVGGKPATFSHDDAITLFHEAGHGLHHLLTRIDDLAVSGIHGVEWDAVELPSQFMENFCWEWDVVCEMTAHAETGEPLPKELFDKMLAAKNFQSGMGTVRQLEFSLFDLLLHMDFDPARQSYMDLLAEVRKEVAVLVPPAWHRFPNSFSHIFAGGYSAGYYSYKWAEVLSADAFAAFEEAAGPAGSVLHAETGERFWNEILAVGGSRPALESFKAFRGREPQVDALLRHSGMVSA
ncbi:MAG: M3 family metallopeptidase [Zoogloea oleivorans]|jgi:oligopeptidase A|uniref:M3 family metallopeptidase n=1 Tax=Zoogloea oleivorans TaxID=1552750 RepID=UPI002A35F144|nr:M3 family metallopeptidase [Zoogloea oleivorans]MDY0034591.1 M3 family metallopeptidase [Zoogloea oleivorans]